MTVSKAEKRNLARKTAEAQKANKKDVRVAKMSTATKSKKKVAKSVKRK